MVARSATGEIVAGAPAEQGRPGPPPQAALVRPNGCPPHCANGLVELAPLVLNNRMATRNCQLEIQPEYLLHSLMLYRPVIPCEAQVHLCLPHNAYKKTSQLYCPLWPHKALSTTCWVSLVSTVSIKSATFLMTPNWSGTLKQSRCSQDDVQQNSLMDRLLHPKNRKLLSLDNLTGSASLLGAFDQAPGVGMQVQHGELCRGGE